MQLAEDGAVQDPNKFLEKIANSFDRHGVKSLLVSKFILGLDAVALQCQESQELPCPVFSL
jgi:hypothetical protein